MLDKKKLTLALFASLGLNIFLGGTMAGAMMGGESKHPRHHHGEHHQKAHQDESLAERPGPPGKHPRALGDEERHGPGPKGPSDLILLRQMVRIMGGPKDPRIAKIHENRKSEIHEMRSSMQAAHKRVHAALTAEPTDDEELRAALRALRKTAFEGQARAQEGILTLSSLMTPEEREKLRHFEPGRRKNPAAGKGPAPGFRPKKNAPPPAP